MLHKNIWTLWSNILIFLWPCLTHISLLFDDSCKGKKGTCPSYLAVVLSGRRNTYLVTLSVAHWLLAFFQHSCVFSFALMHLRNFIICSLMCLSLSNTSNGSQWTGPCSLQINIHTHIVMGTYNNFIFYQYLLQHASYLWLFFKLWLYYVKQHKIILLSLVL